MLLGINHSISKCNAMFDSAQKDTTSTEKSVCFINKGSVFMHYTLESCSILFWSMVKLVML